MRLKPSVIVLILAHLVPLGGVVLLDWQVVDILMLYWAENVIIGAINVLRMLICRSRNLAFLIPFFVMHYGVFCFAHLSALIALFSEEQGAGAAWQAYFAMPFGDAIRSPLWIGIVAIFLSHLVSFFANFIAGGEYRNTTAQELMRRPYGRIIALHITVIIGAGLSQWLGGPAWMLVVLVAVKVVMDVRLHASERRRFSEAPAISS